VAQSWRENRRGRGDKPLRPLDSSALERYALRYVERYATTEAKLAAYLKRKLMERGWAGEGASEAAIEALVGRIAALGYVNDEAFATARAASLARRGYGPRRLGVALRAAGVEGEAAEEARTLAAEQAWASALAFARRKRIGPFAESAPDRAAREKAYAALLRAGHSGTISRKIVMAEPGHVPEEDA
jgi:regulatory protein